MTAIPLPTSERTAPPGAGLSTALPHLENGDRLTRAEFERRYSAMPSRKKAELIEGVVYMSSPVRIKPHAQPHADIMGWLSIYRAATPGVLVADNGTVRLDADNEVQPDALMWLAPELGGRAHLSSDEYLEGAPELVVEIAASSAAIDLNTKLNVYRRNGVREYIVWSVFDQRVDWFYLTEEGEYEPLKADDAGVVRSKVFPGLHLAVKALLAGDLAPVLAEAQAGVATETHKAFGAQLTALKNQGK